MAVPARIPTWDTALPDRIDQTVRKLDQEFRGDPAKPLSLHAARGG